MNPNKEQISRAFAKSSAQYDNLAKFQQDVCKSLIDFSPVSNAISNILDAGCGTGYAAKFLHERFPQARIFGCDIAHKMLLQAKNDSFSGICADLENMPFANNCFDLIFSSLALQWCSLPKAFSEFNRVLKKNGQIVFSTLTVGTLREIETVFSEIDGHRHVINFADTENIMKLLADAYFLEIKTINRTWTTYHPDLKTLLQSIRGIGAGEVGTRRKTMMGKNAWKHIEEKYEKLRTNQGLPLTYEVLFICAQKATL